MTALLARDAPPLQRGYLATPRGQLHYVEAGQGPQALLLLHATARSSRCYRRMMPLLARHHRVIAPDLPGFGQSHGLEQVHGIEDLAACLVDLLDGLGVGRAHLFGLHLGNKVGAALAAGWPARVGHVVLAGQTHSLIVDRARRDREIARLSRHHYLPAAAADDAQGLARLQAWAAVNATAQDQWWTRSLRRASRVRDRDIDDARCRLVDYLGGQPSLQHLYPMVHDFDMTDAFRRIAARTLVLELLTDEEMHLGPQAPAMAALMQRASHAALQDADNMVLEERAEEVCTLLLDFLSASGEVA